MAMPFSRAAKGLTHPAAWSLATSDGTSLMQHLSSGKVVYTAWMRKHSFSILAKQKTL
jgi:hypothetical protein